MAPPVLNESFSLAVPSQPPPGSDRMMNFTQFAPKIGCSTWSVGVNLTVSKNAQMWGSEELTFSKGEVAR